MQPRLLLFNLLLVPVVVFAGDPSPPASVSVLQPTTGEIIRYVTLPGSVRANHQATLYAKVAGYVKSVAVDRGQAVKAGEQLAQIEVPERLADLKRNEAEVKVAEIELQRLTEAQKKAPDLVLPQALDRARGALATSSAARDGTLTMLGFSKIEAPFDGIITRRFVDPGAFVPAATAGSNPEGAALFTLMDFSIVRIQTGMPEIEAPLVQTGLPVKILIEQLPGVALEGRVARFAYALDEATRTMPVEIDLPNPDGRLRPGMYASVKIGVEKHADALLIPTAALVLEKTNAFVFKLVDGKAKKTPVTVGFNDGVHVEMLKGVDAGDQIIAAGKSPLADGHVVQVSEAK